ncbi:type II secretion system minor pseudopilin GspJ [Sulfuriflexus mobilis]|uniref:type II secretion system minor pseudopilin GspJ n=1 Tax=Sulfuriflexus mobilis TaxID=1811807 RepID=UPI000F8463B0|nr:type II secretion system minor pseudopilin GspJ [Sulfuriflexus mobilis]
MCSTRQAGLTLIELLVAVAIFSLLAALSYGGLVNVLDSRRAVDVESQRLATLQRAFLRIGRDLEQAAPRAIRDAFGDQQPALHNQVDSYEGMQTVIELSVAGRRTLPGETRGSLQRISYVLRGDALLRLSWPVLDRAQDTTAHESSLLDGVEDLQLRYLTEDGDWLTQWPPVASATPAVAALPPALPRAIELNIELKHWGSLRRLYRVAG